MLLDKKEIRRKLEGRKRLVLEPLEYVPSAVLMPLFDEGEETCFLLTRRSQMVESHKGQISFPGGVVEPGDGDLLATALREAEEEIGLESKDIELLGALDDSYTVTGFRVTPFAGVVPYPYPYHPSEREIEELITIPVKTFLDGGNLRQEQREYRGNLHLTYFYDCGPHVVWGATARIIHHFVEVITS